MVGNGVSGLFELVGNVETKKLLTDIHGIIKCAPAPGSGRPECKLNQDTQAIVSDA